MPVLSPELIRFFVITIIFICFYLSTDKLLNSLANRLDENNKVMFWKVGRTITHYLFFFVYFFFVLNYLVDVTIIGTLFTLMALLLTFIFQRQITSFVIGFYRIMNRVVTVNDNVILNNEHKGTVREITLNTIKLFKGSNSVITMAHSDVKTIEKAFDGYVPIYSNIVLSFREDPEKAEDVLIKLTEKLNEKYRDYLMKDEEDNVQEPFVYKGIKNLNADYQGIEYSIKGVVHTQDSEEIQRKLDRELAICCYKNNLKTTEQNVFFKTRLENK